MKYPIVEAVQKLDGHPCQEEATELMKIVAQLPSDKRIVTLRVADYLLKLRNNRA